MPKYLSYILLMLFFVVSLRLLAVMFYDTLVPYSSDDGENEEHTSHDANITNSPVQEARESVHSPTENEAVKNSNNTAKDETPDKTETTARESDPGSDNRRYFEDLKDTYLGQLVDQLPEGRAREDVVIRYYKRPSDGEKVYALRKLRYYIHERDAVEGEGPESNVVYYGKDVKREDIRIVAFTLLEEGLPIKSIQPSAYPWKSNAIEVGFDSLLVSDRNLSLADIRSFQD